MRFSENAERNWLGGGGLQFLTHTEHIKGLEKLNGEFLESWFADLPPNTREKELGVLLSSRQNQRMPLKKPFRE